MIGGDGTALSQYQTQAMMKESERPMKLSAVIREGAKLHPQCFGSNFEYWEGHVTGSCAFGAAYAALFPEAPNDAEIPDLEEALNTNLYVERENPETSEMDELFNIITDLNDQHRWSREQIADWLESIDE